MMLVAATKCIPSDRLTFNEPKSVSVTALVGVFTPPAIAVMGFDNGEKGPC
jgi:hypothetical protein